MEPLAFATLTVDPLVVDPRCGDLDGAGDRLHAAWFGTAVAHDEPVTTLVTVLQMLGDVRIDLGLEGHGQHAARPFAADLVDPEPGLLARGLLSDYLQHWRSFLPPAFDRRHSSKFVQRGRYAAPRSDGRSTGFGYNSRLHLNSSSPDRQSGR